MKPGKVIEITPTGTWKDLFKFDYKVEDVETKETHVGGALHKTDKSPYHVDMILNYEIIVNDKGFSNIKFQNEKPAFSAKSNFTPIDPEVQKRKELSIIRQSSLKAATELCCNGYIKYNELLIISELFTDWVLGNIPARPMNEPTDKMPF